MNVQPTYEEPRIVSVSRHFVPDNSNFCCPICGTFVSAGAEHMACGPAGCEECVTRWEPEGHRTVSTVHAFADFISQPLLCVDHSYPIRYPDGQGKLVCHDCVTRNRDPRDLAFCASCRFLVERRLMEGDKCRWCSRLGQPKSILVAMLARNQESWEYIPSNVHDLEYLETAFWNPGKHDWDSVSLETLEAHADHDPERLKWRTDWLVRTGIAVAIGEGEARRFFLHDPPCMDVARHFDPDRGFDRPNAYQKLLDMLGGPAWGPEFSRFVAELEAPHEHDFEHVFKEAGLEIEDRNLGWALQFLAVHEAARLGENPQTGEVFRVIAEPDALKRFERSLSTGLGLTFVLDDWRDVPGRAPIESLVTAIAGETKGGQLLPELCRRYPTIPRIAWLLYLLLSRYRHRAWHAEAVEVAAEEPGLALALIAWDFWYRMQSLSADESLVWWPLVQALSRSMKTTPREILDLAWEYGSPAYAGPLPPEADRSVMAAQALLEALVARASFDTGTIRPWNNWYALHLLLSGRRPDPTEVPLCWAALLVVRGGHEEYQVRRDETDRRFALALETGLPGLPAPWQTAEASLARTGRGDQLIPLLRRQFETDTAWWPTFCRACHKLAPEENVLALPALERALQREAGEKTVTFDRALHLFYLALVQDTLGRADPAKATLDEFLSALRAHVEAQLQTESNRDRTDALLLERMEACGLDPAELICTLEYNYLDPAVFGPPLEPVWSRYDALDFLKTWREAYWPYDWPRPREA